MKVFLCWSGDRSKAIALALYDWLPKIIQKLEPWMSKESIAAGRRWRDEVAKHLELCHFGILCITADNLKAEWIHFEAGALAKRVEHACVVPYVHGVKKSSVKDPLAQFQTMTATREGTLDLLKALNGALPDAKLSDAHLKEQFEVWWTKLEKKLAVVAKMSAPGDIKSATRDTDEILEELVQRIRSVESALSTLSQTNALTSTSLVPRPGTPARPGGVTATVEPIDATPSIAPAPPKKSGPSAKAAKRGR